MHCTRQRREPKGDLVPHQRELRSGHAHVLKAGHHLVEHRKQDLDLDLACLHPVMWN